VADPARTSADERVRRSVGRRLRSAVVALALLVALSAWVWRGWSFTLRPGEAAVLLLFGRHVETITREGFHVRLPAPFLERYVVRVRELRTEDFGLHAGGGEETPAELHEATMQTSDNNIVRVSFTVQYTVKDPFEAGFHLEDPAGVVRDAAQAAMREVVGHTTVDGVLREKKALVTAEAARRLQEILDAYGAGLDVAQVQLQGVQPPAEVRAAFDDVVAANQDASRLVNEAEGHRNEVVPKARAEAAEVLAQAQGFREAKVAEATGAATRFRAIAAEYRLAPEVTRERLYLETMEEVLPRVEKVIVEPGAASLVPTLPIGRGREPRP